ncbi:MAG: UPF0182 family protein [Syntrophomonadaceae bacterium]|nr:UPF0182 family protein [Syntrophomonadaceae bacterium]
MKIETRRPMGSTAKLIIFMLAIMVLSKIASLYVEWLWFQSVDFASVFSKILLNKIALYVIMFAATLALFMFNLHLTRRHLGPIEEPIDETEEGRTIIYLDQDRSPWQSFIKGRNSKWIFLGVSIFAAFLVSSVAAENWLTVQQYLNRTSMGTTDPIFHKDLGYYFFNLAFYKFVYSTLMMALVLLIIALGAVYIVNASSDLLFGDWRQFSFAKGHMAVLLALVFALKAWGYKLAAYDILFSPSGIVFGASYTDIFARLLSYRVLLLISLVLAAVILINIFVKKFNWILISLGAWLVIAVLLGGVYPSLIQNLVVKPNEFNKEKPYIENAIKLTRQAYGLDTAEIKEFKLDNNLDINSSDYQSTINNVRLWDWQPLQTTYKNLQQLRSYYVFNDVDVDRYMINGQYRQVMLSAREIDQEELPSIAKTWINQRLMYTHGYGVVVSPVNEIAEEGFPKFFIKDIPPSFSSDLEITRPEIYFGERTKDYVIVNTKQKEFDYPEGEKNVSSVYKGDEGIKIKSFVQRLLFSWALKDYKMLLSTEITNSSQILMNRNIVQRMQMIAPYLHFDNDPYIVINDDGKLYWMLDAYTVTNMYPYAQPFDQQGNNYIRNSVKVVCDAYSGKMSFYVADNSDPIIKTYSKIFPKVYQPLDQMPAGLKAHIRYPEDIFSIQAEMYKTFHMMDPSVFYNKEDPWLIPNEIVGSELTKMEPYYIIMHLPGSSKAEYILMTPFSPKSRPNMVAWMAARTDGDNYGKMLVYRFPKQETIYGPEQIESRINQNTEIAQQISLWDQRGSKVYRGNLLVIPLKTSLLYVEPLYLQAEKNNLPELKRVIVGFENKIVMEPSLDQALLKLFNKQPGTANDVTQPANIDDNLSATEGIEGLAKLAREYYNRANQLLKEGDWAGYGENIKKLNEVISKLEAAAMK